MEEKSKDCPDVHPQSKTVALQVWLSGCGGVGEQVPVQR